MKEGWSWYDEWGVEVDERKGCKYFIVVFNDEFGCEDMIFGYKSLRAAKSDLRHINLDDFKDWRKLIVKAV